MQKSIWPLVIFLFLLGLGTYWARPFTAVCPAGTQEASNLIPEGALWNEEMVRRQTPPEGFHTAVAWVNAVTASSCVNAGSETRIDFRAIRIIERDLASHEEKIVKEVRFENTKEGYAGNFFARNPMWFADTDARFHREIHVRKNPHQAFFSVDLAVASERVYHAWTDPRTPIRPNAEYFVEAEVRITGGARLQLGLDYWRDEKSAYNGYDEACQNTNNCEAWIGDWYGDTRGAFVTLRSPRD